MSFQKWVMFVGLLFVVGLTIDVLRRTRRRRIFKKNKIHFALEQTTENGNQCESFNGMTDTVQHASDVPRSARKANEAIAVLKPIDATSLSQDDKLISAWTVKDTSLVDQNIVSARAPDKERIWHSKRKKMHDVWVSSPESVKHRSFFQHHKEKKIASVSRLWNDAKYKKNMLILYLTPKNEPYFTGDQVCSVLLEYGLRLDDDDFFCWHAPLNNETHSLCFWVGSSLQLSTFDRSNIQTATYEVLVFFMYLPALLEPRWAFKNMMDAIDHVSQKLSAHVNDEHLNLMTLSMFKKYAQRMSTYVLSCSDEANTVDVL